MNALDAADHAAGRKVRAIDQFHQLPDGNGRIVNLRADAVNDLAQVMRRHVGGHADGDACPAVDKQIGKGRRQDRRLGETFIVVGNEIHRILVHVQQQRGAQVGEPRLGVTHGRGGIVFDGAEVALAIHKPFAHRPRLRQMHERRINHRFAMGVVITGGLAADFRAFHVLAPGKERELLHRVKDASLAGLEAVTHVGQRA